MSRITRGQLTQQAENSNAKVKTARFIGHLLFIPGAILLSLSALSLTLYLATNILGHLNNYVTNSNNVIDWSVSTGALVGAGFLTVVGIILLIPGWILKKYGYARETNSETSRRLKREEEARQYDERKKKEAEHYRWLGTLSMTDLKKEGFTKCHECGRIIQQSDQNPCSSCDPPPCSRCGHKECQCCGFCNHYPCECPCPTCGHHPCDCYYE